MDPDEVYGGKIGERDGGDKKQHGGREEEDNTRDAESSGRHVGLGGEEDTSRTSFFATLYRSRWNHRDVTHVNQRASCLNEGIDLNNSALSIRSSRAQTQVDAKNGAYEQSVRTWAQKEE